MKKITVVALLFGSLAACAQENIRADLTLSGQGLFTNSTTEKTFIRKADASGGLLFSLRYWPTRHNGFEFNYGHANHTETVTSGGVSNSLKTGLHEVTGAYMFRFFPREETITPFVEVGGGIVQFNPRSQPVYVPAAQSQNKPTILYGAGLDFALVKSFAVRLEYRGLAQAAPSFFTGTFRTDTVQHLAEVALGFSYRF